MENVNFGELVLCIDFCTHFDSLCVLSCFNVSVVVDEHESLEFDDVADFSVDFLDLDEHVLLDFVLLASAFNYCVHCFYLL